jgi:hypothetical protein
MLRACSLQLHWSHFGKLTENYLLNGESSLKINQGNGKQEKCSFRVRDDNNLSTVLASTKALFHMTWKTISSITKSHICSFLTYDLIVPYSMF